MAERIDREELRQLIREALREALGAEPSPPSSRGRDRAGAAPSAEGSLHASRGPSPTPPHKGEGKEYRKDSGVLTEAVVAKIGRTHAKIAIGAEVAVTPLARDRARQLKIEIVRQKP